MPGWVWTPKPVTPLQDSLYLFNKLQPYENTVNYKWQSRRRFFLLMRSWTPPLSSEFRGGGGGGGGGLNTPNPPSRYATAADLYWWEILQGIVCLTCELSWAFNTSLDFCTLPGVLCVKAEIQIGITAFVNILSVWKSLCWNILNECIFSSSSRCWTSFNGWKFWPSQRHLSISLDTGHRLSGF